MNTPVQLSIRRSFGTILIGCVTVVSSASLRAQSVANKETALMVQRALLRLPYYGVFDFLAFGVNRGVVNLGGFAYRANLKSDASAAIKRVAGVDEIANKIWVLPASQNDDRIRSATFYKIYTDDFLSRYAPGGAMSARYEALSFARFPGMQVWPPPAHLPAILLIFRAKFLAQRRLLIKNYE